MFSKFVTVLTLFGLVCTVVCQSDISDYRLPKTTYPIDYTIWLDIPDLTNKSFQGEVEIRIGVKVATSEIVLNKFNLEFYSIELIKVDDDNRIDIPIHPNSTQNLTNRIRLDLDDYLLEIGMEYILKITYSGALTHPTIGFKFEKIGIYRATYSSGPNEMLATNFLPRHAMRAFPCYDEPEFQATFTLSIRHAAGYNGISNMNVLEKTTTEGNNLVTTTFNKTSLLSTHMIAFAISNFRFICNDKILKICVYLSSGHTEADVQLILEITETALVMLESYIGLSLDLPKLDVISVYEEPDFMIGNQGLLLNRESQYYCNPAKSDLLQKDKVIRHTIRQIVNLYLFHKVTPEWWLDTWVNDGLSILLEHIIADKMYPELRAMEEFIDSVCQFGFTTGYLMKSNNLYNSHFLLTQWFNGREQHKSAGIMYMFKSILGEEIFKDGLRKLLSGDNKFINSDVFLNIFKSLAGAVTPNSYDLSIIMNDWIMKSGCPIFKVNRDYSSDVLTVSQKDVSDINSARITTKWLPYNYKIQNNESSQWTELFPNGWLENIQSKELHLGPILSSDKWILFNNRLSGLYHTNYDEKNWNLLTIQLETDYTQIPPISRAQLVHDSIELGMMGDLKLGVAFEIVNYIDQEESYAPLSRFLNWFNELDGRLYGTHIYSNFTKFTANKIKNVYERVRFIDLNENPDLPLSELKLRNRTILMACRMGLRQCLRDTNKIITETFENTNGIQTIFRHKFGNGIFNYGMVLANKNIFWKIVERCMTAFGSDYIEGIGYIQTPELVDALLEILITANGQILNGVTIHINRSDRYSILNVMARYNHAALDKVLTFLKEKSDAIKIFIGTSLISNLPIIVTTNERLNTFLDIRQIYTNDSIDGSDVTKAESNVAWANNKIPQFEATLSRLVEGVYDDEEDGDGGDGSDDGDGGGDDEDDGDNEANENDGDGGSANIVGSTILMLVCMGFCSSTTCW